MFTITLPSQMGQAFLVSEIFWANARTLGNTAKSTVDKGPLYLRCEVVGDLQMAKLSTFLLAPKLNPSLKLPLQQTPLQQRPIPMGCFPAQGRTFPGKYYLILALWAWSVAPVGGDYHYD